MNTNNFIYSTAEKYQKTTILERLKALEADKQLKIGFVGMFSAGKTSLINALLDTHLPVNPNPTTKSICVIESDDNLEKNEYFLENNGNRIKSSFMEFDEVVSGKNSGVAVVRVPVKNEIPSGVVYVDTPGVDNYASDETDLTYRYLALLDAAVVCIDINEGTVRKSLLDFISVPELFALSSRMFFVLTHADTKNQTGINAISEDVYNQIKKFAEKTKFDTKGLKERIVAVNANKHDSAVQIVNIIHNYVLKDRENIYKERLKNAEKKLAKELSVMLQDDLENLKFDLPELSEKKKLINRDLDNIEEELKKKKHELNNLKSELNNDIYSILQSHETDVINAPNSESLQQILYAINQEIVEMAQAKVQRMSNNIVVSIGEGLGNDLLNKMNRIDFTKNLSVTVLTSAVTAFIAPGAGVAANAAEGVAGAAVQTAGKSAVTNTIKEAAKKTATEAAKNNSKPGLVGNLLRGVGEFIHAINPLEMIGDWVASEVKHNTYSSTIKSKSIQMANNIVYLLEDTFDTEVIKPLKNRYEEQSNNLELLAEEKRKGLKDFSDKRNEIISTISKLSTF